MGVFERKVLRTIFGPVRVDDDICFVYNSELYGVLNDMDVVQRINIQRLQQCHSNGERYSDKKWVFNAQICGSRERGRPCVTNWRRRARSRGDRPKSVNQVLHGRSIYSQSFFQKSAERKSPKN